MQREIHESVCDRCGKVYKTEDEYKRGSTGIGKAWELLARIPEFFSTRNGDVNVRLYYMSHYKYTAGERDRIVDLCDYCKSELSSWFNEPRFFNEEFGEKLGDTNE